MVDQDEIEEVVFSWLTSQKGKSRGSSDTLFERWEWFVASHEDETAEALRQSAAFEAFRLADALMSGIRARHQTGAPLDESIIERIRKGGSGSFGGDREMVRFYLEVACTVFRASDGS